MKLINLQAVGCYSGRSFYLCVLPRLIAPFISALDSFSLKVRCADVVQKQNPHTHTDNLRLVALAVTKHGGMLPFENNKQAENERTLILLPESYMAGAINAIGILLSSISKRESPKEMPPIVQRKWLICGPWCHSRDCKAKHDLALEISKEYTTPDKDPEKTQEFTMKIFGWTTTCWLHN